MPSDSSLRRSGQCAPPRTGQSRRVGRSFSRTGQSGHLNTRPCRCRRLGKFWAKNGKGDLAGRPSRLLQTGQRNDNACVRGRLSTACCPDLSTFPQNACHVLQREGTGSTLRRPSPPTICRQPAGQRCLARLAHVVWGWPLMLPACRQTEPPPEIPDAPTCSQPGFGLRAAC